MFGRKAARILELEEEIKTYQEERKNLQATNEELSREVVGLRRDAADLREENKGYATVMKQTREALEVPDGENVVSYSISLVDRVRSAETLIAGAEKLLEAGEQFYKARKEAIQLAYETNKPSPKKAKRG